MVTRSGRSLLQLLDKPFDSDDEVGDGGDSDNEVGDGGDSEVMVM
jgi:hypothetical protein